MNPKTTLTTAHLAPILGPLAGANRQFAASYPGPSGRRQPVHLMVGGAHRFKANTARHLGDIALETMAQYAPDFVSFARAMGLPGAESLPASAKGIAALQSRLESGPERVRQQQFPAWLAYTVHRRVLAKLAQEPVEDYRLDFEDGYGYRPDAEEDHHAVAAAQAVAQGLAAASLPPFIGIRLKPLAGLSTERAVRTLDLFMTTLVEQGEGRFPPHFAVTLPKVTMPAQVAALAQLLATLEEKLGLETGCLCIELMVETPQALVTQEGKLALPALAAAAAGRCTTVHLGIYDLTASLGISAANQSLTHPLADTARHLIQLSLADRGIHLSDSPGMMLPIGPHRPPKEGASLSAEQVAENRVVVHRAWQRNFQDIQHALSQGYYQGWDLHPAQLPARYAAVYTFYRQKLAAATQRLLNFLGQAAQATRLGTTFDDAATARGLYNFFSRATECGAITTADMEAAGFSPAEVVRVMEGRP